MKKTNQPQIVPTLMSSKGALWCLVMIGYFLAAFLIYQNYDQILLLKKELKKPVATEVSNQYMTLRLPRGWQQYAVKEDDVEVYRIAGQKVPFAEMLCDQDELYPYRALDENKILLLRRLADRLRRHGYKVNVGTSADIDVIGTEVIHVKPGIYGVRMLFDYGEYIGSSVFFLVGDRRYFFWALAADEDLEGQADIQRFGKQFADCVSIPDRREAISRPRINSSTITPAQDIAVQEQAERELALWRLFSERVAHEPDAALLPAISHFRTALELLSSVRLENGLLASDDFNRYKEILAIRAGIVSEWFVKLDKLEAIGDLEGARKQARFIIANATLVDESLDARRASARLIALTPADAE